MSAPSAVHSTSRWRQLLLAAVIVAVLVAVFAFYTRPEFLVRLADQVWACF